MFLIYFVVIISMFYTTTARGYGKDGCRGSTTRHVDPSNCHSYFQCISGVKYRAHCEPGSAFSRLTQKCELSVRTPCSANKRTGHPMEGRRCSTNGEIRPSELECSKYLLCRINRYIALSCPFGLIFSNVKFRCVLPPDPCSVTEQSQKSNGTLQQLELKKEENPYIGICDSKINQTVAEPFDCSMYILCEEDSSNETYVQAAISILECPNRTLFSASENKCKAHSSVFCDQRYRVVTLYGPDVVPASLGRSLGRSMGRAVSQNPTRPKYWVQPGKYRAFYKRIPNRNTTARNNSNSSSGNTENSKMVTTSINGLIIQKPLQAETPSPVSAEQNYTYESVESSTSVPGPPNGRSFKQDTGFTTVGSEARAFLNNLPTTPMPHNNQSRKNTSFELTSPLEPGTVNTKAGFTNTIQNSLITNNVNSNGGSHHQPVVVNIILGEPHQFRGATSADIKSHLTNAHDLWTDFNNASKDDLHEPPSSSKFGGSGRSVVNVIHLGNGTGSGVEKSPGGYDHSVSAKSLAEIDDSSESDEGEPFKFNKTQPRAPKRHSVLDDYHAMLNGRRFNSTAEDILYYGEDEYYIGESNENETETQPGPNRVQSSLELSHHELKAGTLPKQKLPQEITHST